MQGLVSELGNSPKSGDKEKPEVIRPGVAVLPELPPLGPEACLAFSDWLHISRPQLSDISDSSEELWDCALQEAGVWYSSYLRLDALGRLTAKPTPSDHLSRPKWARVARRIETMILAALPSPIRDEVSASRVTGLLALVCRLYVIYAPGSLTEREIGLRSINGSSFGFIGGRHY